MIAAQGPGLQRGHAPFLHQGRQHHAINDQVVSVEDDDQRAPEQHTPVEGIELRLIDQAIDIDSSHVACLFCCCYRNPKANLPCSVRDLRLGAVQKGQ
ncbi:hypothetical protein D3C75_979060 [compost metagenome]